MSMPSSNPWAREQERLATILQRLASTDRGPVQGIVLGDPPGFGAIRHLELIEEKLRAGTDSAVAALPPRHDRIVDWPTLALEILAAAHAGGAPHGTSRAGLEDRRRSFGAEAFREHMDFELGRALREYGRLTLLIPHLDALLEELPKRDQWAFRSVLQSAPLALIATAEPYWRPNSEEAFFQFFRRIELNGYQESEISALAASNRLKKPGRALLEELRLRLHGRPALLEAAARAAADAATTTENMAEEAIVRRVAEEGAPRLHAKIAGRSQQQRLVLTALADASGPASTGAVAEATGLTSGVASVQITRLIEAGLVSVTSGSKRNRRYDFVDAVGKTLYRSLIGLPLGPPPALEAAA